MINLASKFYCTGCHACVNACPQKAITMLPDQEGFLQPYVDRNRCVECGICQKKCPALNDVNPIVGAQKAYALISNQDRTLSSSGGAFSVFSRIILNRGGIVFGATLDKELQCRHISVESVEDLRFLRGAKYIQSEIGESFKLVKQCLKDKRMVLFSGTPCQIAGLYSYLGGRYDDLLITIDLICHGVPNQQIFNAYVGKLQQEKKSKILDFRFRKLDSWSLISSAKFENGKYENLYLWDNAYMSAFFKGITFRESCFNCKYCNLNRIGTFTIADFWGIGGSGVPFKKNVAKGVSLVLDNFGMMPRFMNNVQDLAYIEERSVLEVIEKQHNLKAPVRRLPERDFAIKLLLDENVKLKDFSKKCGLPCRRTIKNQIILIMKKMIDFCGAYNIYKTISYKMGKNS